MYKKLIWCFTLTICASSFVSAKSLDLDTIEPILNLVGQIFKSKSKPTQPTSPVSSNKYESALNNLFERCDNQYAQIIWDDIYDENGNVTEDSADGYMRGKNFNGLEIRGIYSADSGEGSMFGLQFNESFLSVKNRFPNAVSFSEQELETNTDRFNSIKNKSIIYMDSDRIHNSTKKYPVMACRWSSEAADEDYDSSEGNDVDSEQCIPNKHTEVPSVVEEDYNTARELLLKVGWQPYQSVSFMEAPLLFETSPALEFWNRGNNEVYSCAGTGVAPCLFLFKDIYGNGLSIATVGESDNPSVSNVTILCPKELQQFQKRQNTRNSY